MRRLPLTISLLTLTALLVAPAAATAAQTTPLLDRAGSALRSDPVYVDADAEGERSLDDDAANGLRQRIRSSGTAIFLAIVPAEAIAEAGGDVNRLPAELASRTGLAGTYGVVTVGSRNSFRAGASSGPPGRAGSLATAAFQAHSDEGTEAVLTDFVRRVAEASNGQGQSGQGQSGQGSPSAQSPLDRDASGGGDAAADDGGGSSPLPLLLLLGAGAGGLWYWSRKRTRAKTDEDRRNRSVLEAQLAVLADDVVNLESLVGIHPDAQPDYEAAVSRYRVAQAALENREDPIDLVRVGRLLDEAQYAMSRAKAAVEGRQPPPPPPELTQPGRRGEPPVDLDDDGRPAYVGSGSSPFYGGGWFGGGGGLMTGLFLGQMLGGGWGGYGGHDTNVYVDNSGSDSGGDSGDGDYGGGDFGGGDWGGGDFGGGFGGGDFGGGDIGGGDW
ncbi:MAG TPA: hypothetical protein VM942_07495 [Acidimicrobiales bacterium]|nr:hypothetical protein [Acidimicrobiales bacterium]